MQNRVAAFLTPPTYVYSLELSEDINLLRSEIAIMTRRMLKILRNMTTNVIRNITLTMTSCIHSTTFNRTFNNSAHGKHK